MKGTDRKLAQDMETASARFIELSNEVESLEDLLEKKEKIITELQDEVSDLKNQIEDLEALLDEK